MSPSSVACDRDDVLGGAALPAVDGVRRAGERAARDLRARLRGVLGAARAASASRGSSPSPSSTSGSPPYAKWYLGGTLNICFNCVDRHVEAGLGGKVAYHWEGEPEDERRTITFADLQREVVRLANALEELGVGKGTPVGIYMGMVPELPVAMLACARIGAPHTVVFGGFSADSLSGRHERHGLRGADHPGRGLAQGADGAAEGERRRGARRRARRCATGSSCAGRERRADARRAATCGGTSVADGDDPACPCEPMDSEDLLYLLYTRGTTAKPKGIAHTTAGYLVGVATTHHYIFDVKPDSVYWCAADVGWVTGHSTSSTGRCATGRPASCTRACRTTPTGTAGGRSSSGTSVDILYTAPTAIRSHMKWGPRARGQARPVVDPAAGLGRRADQPGGLGLVPRA